MATGWVLLTLVNISNESFGLKANMETGRCIYIRYVRYIDINITNYIEVLNHEQDVFNSSQLVSYTFSEGIKSFSIMEPENLPGSFQTFRFHLHASEFSLLITFLMKVAAVASSECSVQQRQCRCGLLLVVSCVLCVVSWLLALACWPLEWGSMVLGELGGQQSGQSVGGSFPGNDRHSPGFI